MTWRCGFALERHAGERGGESESERVWAGARDVALFTARSGLTGGASSSVRPPCGVRGLCWSATTAAAPTDSDRWRSRLTACFWTYKSPKPWWIFENFINTKCRTTWVLQDCLKEFGLIPNGFQTTVLQSKVLWNFLSYTQHFVDFGELCLTKLDTDLAHDL